MPYIQLIMFIVSNLPSLLKAVREILDIFDGDAAEVKKAMQEMPQAFKEAAEGNDLSKLRALAERRRERRARK